MNNKVSIGFATVMGVMGAVATALIPFIAELANAAQPLGVPPTVWIIVSAVLTVVTVIGRMWQAAVLAAKK